MSWNANIFLKITFSPHSPYCYVFFDTLPAFSCILEGSVYVYHLLLWWKNSGRYHAQMPYMLLWETSERRKMRASDVVCSWLSVSGGVNRTWEWYYKKMILSWEMFHEHALSWAIVVGASALDHIECPLLDSAGCTVLTKCHVVTSSSLVDLQSFDEFFCLHIVCYLEGRVFLRRYEERRITRIFCMTIGDKRIISSDTYTREVTSVLREVGTGFYFLMEGCDLFESEHSFID